MCRPVETVKVLSTVVFVNPYKEMLEEIEKEKAELREKIEKEKVRKKEGDRTHARKRDRDLYTT